MMTARILSAYVGALAVSLCLLAPMTARAQDGPVYYTSEYSLTVTSSANETLYVTVLNPKPARAVTVTGTVTFTLSFGSATASGIAPEPTRIAPGEARSFAVDPRVSGELLDGVTGARRLAVEVTIGMEEREDMTSSEPTVALEFVDRRTGQTRVAEIIRVKRIKESIEPIS